MANAKQLKQLKKGVEVWNNWRFKNPDVKIDLSGAVLTGAMLEGAYFEEANLKGANLSNTYLKGAILTGADLRGATLDNADLSGADLNQARLDNAFLRGTNLSDAYMVGVELREANLDGAFLRAADLTGAILTKTQLNANLNYANLSYANLNDANLSNANMTHVNLNEAKLRGTNLSEVDLFGANLREADLSGANLNQASLQNAILVGTNLHEATLIGCKIYGISAWGLKGVPKEQSNLIITRYGEAAITVDDLQVAQFIYLLLDNQNVRHVIDTITSKSVLILGRFTPERKEVLDLIREELHNHDYVPILFDFENTTNQSLLESVMTLAGIARFVIADVTAATVVREELRSVVEKYPAKPIQPILLNGEQEYVTLPEMRAGFNNILPTFTYKHASQAVSELSRCIIKPAENWLKARKSSTDIVTELENEIEALKKQLQEKTR